MCIRDRNTEALAALFNVKRPAITKHINNIYAEEELDKESTCQNFRQVRKEGSFPCIKQ